MESCQSFSFRASSVEAKGSITSAVLTVFLPSSICFNRSNLVEWAHFQIAVFLDIGQRVFLKSYEFCCSPILRWCVLLQEIYKTSSFYLVLSGQHFILVDSSHSLKRCVCLCLHNRRLRLLYTHGDILSWKRVGLELCIPWPHCCCLPFCLYISLFHSEKTRIL